MKEKTAEAACVSTKKCIAVTGSGAASRTVSVIHETAIELVLNGRSMMRTQCMARDLDLMAIGFMVCEGLVQNLSELKQVAVDPAAGRVSVEADIPDERLEKHASAWRLASGGGKTGVIDLVQNMADTGHTLPSPLKLDRRQVLSLGADFNSFEGLYRETRFVHSAALSTGQGFLCHSEDLGRHNAVDKVIGYGFRNGIHFGSSVLLCSGRFSLEMVSKAARVGIPVHISPAAPSAEAVLLAERIGMTLCGRVTADRANMYSGAWRIEMAS